MASRRVTKFTVDWADLAKRVPEVQKSNYIAFKAKADGYLRKVLVNPEEPPTIDWSYYKTNAANKALIEQFEKQYTSTKIPYPDDKGAIAQVDAEEKAKWPKIQRFIEQSNERIKQFEQDIVAIKKTRPYEEMTDEEGATYFPDRFPDALNKPTFWPHDEDVGSYTPEEVAYLRKKGWIHRTPDRYYK